MLTICETGSEGRLATTVAVFGAGPCPAGAPTDIPRAFNRDVSTSAACTAGAGAMATRGANRVKPSLTTSAPMGPTSPAAA